jgi:hypothetical protein
MFLSRAYIRRQAIYGANKVTDQVYWCRKTFSGLAPRLQSLTNNIGFRHPPFSRFGIDFRDKLLGQTHGQGFHRTIVLRTCQSCNTLRNPIAAY